MLREVTGVTLNWQRFCSPGAVGNVWRIFWLSFLVEWGQEGGCYKHLVGSRQGCCSTFYNVQDIPPPTPRQRIIQPKRSIVLILRNPGSEARRYPQIGGSPKSTFHLSLVISRKQKGSVSQLIMVDQGREENRLMVIKQWRLSHVY